jgi:hypothetical protein
MLSLIALGSAVGIYVIWYWFEVGQFCLAMWFGTAPFFIIGISFISMHRLLRHFFESE